MTRDVETYFTDGCGRCALGGTPDCKVHKWQAHLQHLRRIVLDCGLTETCKWGVPCYTYQGKNILIVSAYKDSCILGFFKGALLRDEAGILAFHGEHSQASKSVFFTRVDEILAVESDLKDYIFEAVEVEKAGLKVASKPVSEYAVPAEFQEKMDTFPALKSAFEALTPGRQRGYLLHFSTAKQSQTRLARIEKCLPRIFQGKGLMD
jgi:uncharacterized protein YdeI (YjbR/CyaY-like superfamily)